MKVDIFNTDKKYSIIYADPPWKYKTYSDRNVCPYPVMKDEDIYKLPVKNLAADDSVLFMWVTFPKLLTGIKAIEEWGFTYKALGFAWTKKNKKSDSLFWGMGHWTRQNTEVCLLATKGHPKRESKGVHCVVDTPIEAHSKKPNVVRERIVELCGDLPRIELFARQYADGWDCWGNEV